MALATMTTKGQVTVPKAIRDALRLKPGDQVDFVLGTDGSVVVRARNQRLSDLIGIFKYDGPRISIEEMRMGVSRRMRRKFGKPRS